MQALRAAPAMQGWSAYLRLGFRSAPGRTLLAERERRGPLAVQRPFYPEGEVCHVYVLHPPGGVVGGDRLRIEANLASASHAVLTNPGATKFYRSAGETAQQTQQLTVGDGARLEWLPQENILFPGAKVRLHSRIDLQGDARLAFWEIHCLGRPANAEHFASGKLDAQLSIYRDDRPLLLERLRVDPQSLQRGALLRGHPVVACAVFSHAMEANLEQARVLLVQAGSCAATLLGDLLVVRYLGDSTEQARSIFSELWQGLRAPLMQRPACPPRIWNT